MGDVQYVALLMDGCGYCEKLKKVIGGDERFAQVNKDSEQGKNIISILEKKGESINGFPCIVHKTSGVIVMGFRPKVEDIIAEFEDKVPKGSPIERAVPMQEKFGGPNGARRSNPTNGFPNHNYERYESTKKFMSDEKYIQPYACI